MAGKSSSGWAVAIADFTNWARAGGARDSTVRLRRGYLWRLAAAAEGRGPWELVDDDLARFLANSGWGPETRRSALQATRRFYAWAVSVERVTKNPAASLAPVRVPNGAPRPTPATVLEAALAEAPVGSRERLMVMLAAYAGLRRSEIATLHTRDVLSDSLRVTGKGGRVRTVPLHPSLAAAIEAHVVDGAGWVFPGQVDGHLSPDAVGRLVADLLPGDWTAHTLRHRFASMAYAEGRDLRAVQELLGHTKPETTARYTAVPDGALRDAVMSAGPAGPPAAAPVKSPRVRPKQPPAEPHARTPRLCASHAGETAPPAVDQDLAAIAHLDFEVEVPECGHSRHESEHGGAPALMMVETRCPRCARGRRYPMCQPGWDRLGAHEVVCGVSTRGGLVESCGHAGTREDFATATPLT